MKSLGARGEEIAAAYLMKKGYALLHRNYRTPLGEADIVMRDGDTVVFVEVKTRRSDTFGQPFESVHTGKQERLRRIALYFLKHHPREGPVRFDVVSILNENGKPVINHITEAF
ncbi:MAG TPA: YraN family protein [Dissulfurispiraceae bacterium]|nr:YraN family protein [Dissulfurispiraceae bacterium]